MQQVTITCDKCGNNMKDTHTTIKISHRVYDLCEACSLAWQTMFEGWVENAS